MALDQVNLPRAQIGISIVNPVHRRLIEETSAQLGLTPTFLDATDLVRSELLNRVELLVVDEALALTCCEVIGQTLEVSDNVRPARVAVIASSSKDEPPLPQKCGAALRGSLGIAAALCNNFWLS